MLMPGATLRRKAEEDDPKFFRRRGMAEIDFMKTGKFTKYREGLLAHEAPQPGTSSW